MFRWTLKSSWLISIATCACLLGSQTASSAGYFNLGAFWKKQSTSSAVTVEAYYPAASNWNQYSGNEHGGEKRKVVTTSTSCSGMAATDALGVFNWTCSLINGYATFVSSLKTNKGLKDLVTTTAWISNSVTVTGSGGGTTASGAWWTNPVTAASTSSTAPISLNTTGTIYVLGSNTLTSGYTFTTNEVALVSLTGTTITWNSSTTAGPTSTCATGGTLKYILCISAARIWIEANMAANSGVGGPTYAVNLYSQSNLRYHNSTLTVGTGGGITMSAGPSGSTNNVFTDLVLTGYAFNGSNGVSFAGANVGYHTFSNIKTTKWASHFRNIAPGPGFNKFINIESAQCGSSLGAINLETDSNLVSGYTFSHASGPALRLKGSKNVVQNVLIGSSSNGITMDLGAHQNIISQVTIANSYAPSILAGPSGGSSANVIHNALVYNGGSSGGTYGGIEISMASTVGWTFSQLASLSNANNGIRINNAGSTGHKFTGNFLLGGNSVTNCFSSNATSGITGTCTNQGASDATFTTGLTSGTSYLTGPISTNDTTNPSDTNGAATYSTTSDFHNFDNPMRIWNIDAAMGATTSRGIASAAIRIFDWTPKIGSTVIRNTTGTGNSANSAFVAGAACPAEADGNITLTTLTNATYPSTSNLTFLKNAVEVMSDTIGNDNGLCETNEACLYTPNFGAYQGHDTLGTCTFNANSGSVTGVTLYGYATNGR